MLLPSRGRGEGAGQLHRSGAEAGQGRGTPAAGGTAVRQGVQALRGAELFVDGGRQARGRHGPARDVALLAKRSEGVGPLVLVSAQASQGGRGVRGLHRQRQEAGSRPQVLVSDLQQALLPGRRHKFRGPADTALGGRGCERLPRHVRRGRRGDARPAGGAPIEPAGQDATLLVLHLCLWLARRAARSALPRWLPRGWRTAPARLSRPPRGTAGPGGAGRAGLGPARDGRELGPGA